MYKFWQWAYVFSFPECIYLGMEVVGHITPCWASWGTAVLFSKSVAPFHVPISHEWEFQFLYVSANTCYYMPFWLVILSGYEGIFHYDFDLHFPNDTELEKEKATHSSILAWRIQAWQAAVCGVARTGHNLVTKLLLFMILSIFSCTHWPFVYFLRRNSFSLLIFKLGCLFTVELWIYIYMCVCVYIYIYICILSCECILYILNTRPSLDICFINSYSHSLDCLFNFLVMSFEHRSFWFWWSPGLFVVVVPYAFILSYLRKLCLIQSAFPFKVL